MFSISLGSVARDPFPAPPLPLPADQEMKEATCMHFVSKPPCFPSLEVLIVSQMLSRFLRVLRPAPLTSVYFKAIDPCHSPWLFELLFPGHRVQGVYSQPADTAANLQLHKTASMISISVAQLHLEMYFPIVISPHSNCPALRCPSRDFPFLAVLSIQDISML